MKILLILSILIFSGSLFADYNVSDLSGDLSYKYPISSNLVKGHNLDVDITYSSNVSHISLVHLLREEKEFVKYSLPMPLWTINVNGFAINALSHKINPYNATYFKKIYNESPLPDTVDTLYKADFLRNSLIQNENELSYRKNYTYNNIWLIEGYDICNRISELEDGDSDEISILRSDGSVLKLKNTDRVKQGDNINDPKFYTGLYYHDSYNSNIYATVEFDSTSHFPEYITKFLPNDSTRVQYYPRNVKIYMGDGLEYEFKEWISPYGARVIDKIYQKDSSNQKIDDSLKINLFPTIFYLERINTAIGELTSFTREHHNFNNSEVDLYKGHAWTTDFYGHHIDFSGENIIINSLGKSYKIKNAVEICHFEFQPAIVPLHRFSEFLSIMTGNSQIDKNFSTYKFLDKGNLLSAKDTALDYNVSTSLAHHSPKIDELYNGREFSRYLNFQIKEIIDPEENIVKFDYQHVYKTVVNSYGAFEGKIDFFTGFKRLVSIDNSNSLTKFKYYGAINKLNTQLATSSVAIPQDFSDSEEYYDIHTSFYEDSTGYYKFKLNRVHLNSVDSVIQYDKRYGQIQDTSSISIYGIEYINQFFDHISNENINGIFRKTKAVHIDKKLELSSTIESIYSFSSNTPYNYIDSLDNKFHKPNLVRLYKFNNDLNDTCDLDNLDELYLFEFKNGYDINGSQLFEYLTKYKEYVFYDDTICIKNNYTYEYEFTVYEDFDGNFEMANKYGKVIKKQTANHLYPDSNNVVYKKNVKTFLNLPKDTEYLSNVNDSILDYRATYKNILENSRNGIETYDEVIKSEVKNIYQIKPPIIGLVDSTFNFDRNGDIINGIINTFYKNQSGNYPDARRGVILSDTIVGRFGNSKYQNTKFVYDGSRYNSKIKYIIGSNDETTEISYKYSGNNRISSKKWLNNETQVVVDLFKYYPYYDLPVRETKEIKYYDSEGDLKVKHLTNYMEYNSIGLASKIVDYNGNLTLKKFDKIGRELQVNLPYDFPTSNQIFASGSECLPLENQITIRRVRRDTVNYFDSIPKIKIGEWNIVDTIPYTLDIERYTDFTYENRDSVFEFSSQILSNYKSDVEVTYKANNNDALHSTTPDSAQLRVSFIGNNINNCTGINVKTDKFGFEKQYVLGCLSMFNLENIDTNNFQNNSNHILYIDLSDIKDSLSNMNHNEELKFNIEINSPDGQMQIESFNEDTDICITTSFSATAEKSDFTYKYKYNDETQTIEKLNKVDDAKFPTHSFSKSFEESFSDHDGRYYKSKTYKGGDNESFKDEVYVGKPDSYDRIDSSFVEYDKTNHRILNYDILNKLNATKLNLSNRIDTIINYNDTIIENKYYGDTSSNYYDFYMDEFNLQDDYHGLLKTIYTEELRLNNSNKINRFYKFYDSFDRLRAKVIIGSISSSSLDTFKITYYNYNEIGQLSEVINPNGDTTKYIYDEWGNVKYKYHKDKGLTSYKYSQNGQLRFSQNQIQAEENKINYYQYDDLGRQTVVGEAKIDTTDLGLSEPDYPSNLEDNFKRLSDTLNPNLINDGNSSPLTANKTLYDDYYNPSSVDYNMDTTSINPDYIYFPEDDLKQKLLILQKDVDFSEPNLSEIDYQEFENIKDYPQTVLQAFHYDTLPFYKGNIFGKMPDYSKWDTLSQNWSNLKGSVSVMAYRNNSAQNFNFVRYSYDARSRVKRMIRFTENIGFDGVYYDYNSANQITSLTIIDPLRSFKIWYSYDQNGRVDSVWAKVDSVGSGFGVNGKLHQPTPVVRDQKAIFYYTYTKRGSVDTMLFTPHNLIKKFHYNEFGWLDSIKVLKDNIMIYSELIDRDTYGNINKITDKFDNNDSNKIFESEFITNRYNELIEYKQNGSTKKSYTFDKNGNRLTKTVNSFTQNYNYGTGLNSNKLLSVDYQNHQKQFTYNSVGAISSSIDSLYGGSPVLFEEFNYNNFNRLRQYIQYDTAGTDYSACVDSRQDDHWDWRYNYSPSSGMESKKLYYSPTGNNCNIHAFNYYLQGANGEMFVEFNGKQWAKDTLTHTGNRVYYYAKAYNLPGTNFRFKLNESDSSKFDYYDWFIQDHNGATKLVINSNTNVFDPAKKYMNYPYGDSLKTATVGNFDSDLNAFGEIQNHEMPYSIMGFRIYSEELGRFLSPDPLFEKFDSWTPYHFAFNNPVMYSDPSGLAPKKEKREVGLLWLNHEYVKEHTEMLQRQAEELETTKMFNAMNEFQNALLWNNPYDPRLRFQKAGGGGSGGGGSSGGGSGSGNEGPFGVLLSDMNGVNEWEMGETNNDRGVIENHRHTRTENENGFTETYEYERITPYKGYNLHEYRRTDLAVEMENGIVKNATIETMAVDIAISTQSGITSLMYGLGNQLIKSFGEGGAIGNSFKYSRYALGGVGIGVGAGIGIYNTIDVANKYGVNSNEFYESALFTSADLYIGVTAMLINPVLGVGITAIYLYGKYQYRGYYQSPEFFGNKYKYSFPKKGGN